MRERLTGEGGHGSPLGLLEDSAKADEGAREALREVEVARGAWSREMLTKFLSKKFKPGAERERGWWETTTVVPRPGITVVVESSSSVSSDWVSVGAGEEDKPADCCLTE